MATLRIYLLGGLRAYHGDEPLPPFPIHKTRALFAYLVAFRQCDHPRADVAQTFWLDRPTARARRSLNTALWRLRRTVPAVYFQAQGDNIAFAADSDYWLDVAAFERALRQAGLSPARQTSPSFPPTAGVASLRQAVELYRGNCLEGFYEDWALVEAERLRSLYMQTLHGLLPYHRAAGEYDQALDCARWLLTLDALLLV